MNIQITNEGITINGETMQTGTAYADLNGVYFIVYKTGNAEQWRVGCYGTEFDAVKVHSRGACWLPRWVAITRFARTRTPRSAA